MNRELVAEPRERLLEVLLEETLRPESGTASPAAIAPSPSRRRSVWLAAALALLGIGVVIGVAALRRSPGAAVPAQDPQPAPRKHSWQVHVKPVTSQEEWLASVPHVNGVMFRLLRPRADGNGVEEIAEATDYVGGPEARAIAALVPPLGTTAFDVNQVEAPPFDAWIAFESYDGFRVHGFVRLYDQPTLVLGSRRVDTLTDAWQQAMQKMWMQASRRLLISRGVVESLADLETVPGASSAIRCPSPPNGTLAKHLGRFKNLEHLEFVFTASLGAGQPISIQLPEAPTTLFEEMQALPKLRHLRWSGVLLNGDERAAELARLPNLVSLRLDGSLSITTRQRGRMGKDGVKVVMGGITPAGMRVLARKIEALELVDCELSADLLEPWLEAGQLRRLVVFGDAWSPELLARFAHLPTLTELGLGGVAWTDAHLQVLAGSKLTRLRLEHTKVTTAALLRLPASLRTLDLRRQSFDKSAYGELQVALPESRILRPGDVDATDPPLSDVSGASRR